jgi:uncharacterized protein (TIGR02147 family)
LVFEYSNYKLFVEAWVKAQGKAGRGQYKRIAEKLRVHTTYISQVFSGTRHLNDEQAVRLGSVLELSPLEKEYFLLLVQFERTVSNELKSMIEARLAALKRQHQLVERRVSAYKELSDAEKSTFYGTWIYSGVRMLATVLNNATPEAIAGKLDLPVREVRNVLDFLFENNLLKLVDGKVMLGEQRTHVSASSPFVFHHHRNWRLKVMEHHPKLASDDLLFTSPFVLAKKDYIKVREEILAVIERFSKLVSGSCEDEVCAVLNIDLVQWMTK